MHPLGRPARAVVIGYGFAGRSFHSYLVRLAEPALILHGVASRDPATREKIRAERPGARAYESFEEVLGDPDVDLVVLATPTSTHADLAVAALGAGKHVVTDKAISLTLAECERMIAAAEQNDRLLTVFQNRRFDGDFLTVNHLMESGDLGDVRWLEMAWQGFGAWGGWRGKAAMGGGRLYDLGSHLLDQLLVLFTAPVETVYCRMHHDFPPEKTDVESEALVVVTFADGATGVCDLSSLNAISKPRFHVHGSRATFQKFGVDPQERAMIDGNIDAAVEPEDLYGRLKGPDVDRAVPTLPGRWRTYYESVAAALTHGAPPPVTPAEMRRVMSVLDAARESARTGKVIML
jgi:predicted dehydrogenase